MPDLAAAELSIPAEQLPDPAKPLVIPVDSTVVGSTLRFIPWSVVGIRPSSTCPLLLQGSDHLACQTRTGQHLTALTAPDSCGLTEAPDSA